CYTFYSSFIFFFFFFFFFNAPSPSEIYTLSLHDALPIFPLHAAGSCRCWRSSLDGNDVARFKRRILCASQKSFHLNFVSLTGSRSEEHTSELQSRFDLVCRLLLEKKKKYNIKNIIL